MGGDDRYKRLNIKGKEEELKYNAMGDTRRGVIAMRQATVSGNPKGPSRDVRIIQNKSTSRESEYGQFGEEHVAYGVKSWIKVPLE